MIIGWATFRMYYLACFYVTKGRVPVDLLTAFTDLTGRGMRTGAMFIDCQRPQRLCCNTY
jgi:hypothetical protein